MYIFLLLKNPHFLVVHLISHSIFKKVLYTLKML